ncbi:MAG: oligosaccharide flippase family protein [Nitrosomonas sp.]|nr:oligosaccharide flippase family protein [Nitrosomonas sp.]
MYTATELKYSTLHFLTGKAVSALLTFIILLLLVRILSTQEYGMYVLMVAGMELALAILSFGLPWLSARYLPEYRIHSSGRLLVQFVWKIIALFVLMLSTGAFLLFLLMQWLMPIELIHYTPIAQLFLAVLLLEGLSRRIRENILAPLMQQKLAQISLAARNFIFLLLIGIIVFQVDIQLYHVVLAEIIASVVGTLIVLYGLIQHLKIYRNISGKDGWQPPQPLKMWRIARNMYFSSLIVLTYSPQILIFITQRYLGIEATALFGFLCKIYQQIANYLPAKLLFNLIQPKLVASYINSGSMKELMRNANLAGKFSLFVLMPVIIFTWLTGDELIYQLSSGKFMSSGSYLLGLMLAMIPLSQHRILTTIVVAIDKNQIVLWSGLLGVLSLPLAYFFLEMDKGLWGPIIAIISGQILYNITIIAYLVRNTSYRPDTTGFFKLMLVSFSVFIIVQFPIVQLHGVIKLFVILFTVTSFFLLSAFLIKPFKAEERARLNSFINKKIFVW